MKGDVLSWVKYATRLKAISHRREWRWPRSWTNWTNVTRSNRRRLRISVINYLGGRYVIASVWKSPKSSALKSPGQKRTTFKNGNNRIVRREETHRCPFHWPCIRGRPAKLWHDIAERLCRPGNIYGRSSGMYQNRQRVRPGNQSQINNTASGVRSRPVAGFLFKGYMII